MNEPERTERRMPYPEVDFDALHRRIRSATVERTTPRRTPAPRRMLLAASAAAAALVAGGIFLATERHDDAPAPDFDALVASASQEVLLDAAATNYDDILYNQQL